MNTLGFPLIDTSFSEKIHPDSFDPSGIDLFSDDNLIIHYNNNPSEDDGTWIRTNVMVKINLQETSFVINIDSVIGTILKLSSWHFFK